METLPLPGQDALPHLRLQMDQQHKPHQGNQDPYCADRGRKRTRNTETIPTNVLLPKDHETKNRPHGRPRTNTTKGRFNSSSQQWKTGTVGEQASWSRASAEWLPLPTSREIGPNCIPSPKRRPATPRPSPSPKKTSRASSASSCSPSNSLPPTEPRTWWWKVRALDVDDRI